MVPPMSEVDKLRCEVIQALSKGPTGKQLVECAKVLGINTYQALEEISNM